MYKLIILIEPEGLGAEFDAQWPRFLSLAEQMPGLKREATSHIDGVLYGKQTFTMVHELFFESMAALREAMASSAGQQTGQLLQTITQGNMTLLISDHNQDELENILKFRSAEEPALSDEP
jgi:uncharacterized protein (TIGR02118 family)